MSGVSCQLGIRYMKQSYEPSVRNDRENMPINEDVSDAKEQDIDVTYDNDVTNDLKTDEKKIDDITTIIKNDNKKSNHISNDDITEKLNKHHPDYISKHHNTKHQQKKSSVYMIDKSQEVEHEEIPFELDLFEDISAD